MNCQLLASMSELASLGETALVIFVVVFLSITIWALTQTRSDVKHWADLPLDSNPR